MVSEVNEGSIAVFAFVPTTAIEAHGTLTTVGRHCLKDQSYKELRITAMGLRIYTPKALFSSVVRMDDNISGAMVAAVFRGNRQDIRNVEKAPRASHHPPKQLKIGTALGRVTAFTSRGALKRGSTCKD